MRRLVVAAASLFLLALVAAPSDAWWRVHRYHYAQPVAAAAPVTLGFTLPGGVGLNVTPDGSLIEKLREALAQRRPDQPTPGRVTVDSDVVNTISDIDTAT